MNRIVKVSLWVFIVSALLCSCSMFEKDFILPSPVATQATQVAEVSLVANWKKVTGAGSYEVDLALDENFTQIMDDYQGKKANKLSLTFRGLNANTTYYYRVRANVSNQISASSNVVKVTTKALDVPIVYRASNVSATGFRLHWKKMPVVTAYLLDIALDENFNQWLEGYQAREIVADTHVVVKNVAVGKQFYYRVKIRKNNSLSEYSSALSVFTTSLPSPETLPATQVGFTSFIANWKQMSEASSYQIDVSTDPLFENIMPNYTNLNLSANRLLVNGLNANQKYYYRVRAINSETRSNYSKVIVVNTKMLEAPVATNATNIGSNSFKANWQPAPNASVYLLDVALDPNFSQILPTYNSLAVLDNFAEVVGLDASRVYYYRLRAQGLGATSDYSNVVRLVTGLLPAPVVNQVVNQTVNGFTASWQVRSESELYSLEVATNTTFTDYLPGYRNKAVLGGSHTVQGVDFKTNYYYRVRAKQGGKFSAYSSAVMVPACIGNACKLARIDFTGVYEGNDSKLKSQIYIYDGQHRLVEITHQNKAQLRWLVSYQSDGTIKAVDKYIMGALVLRHIYTYRSGVLVSIRQEDQAGDFLEWWKFSYDNKGQRKSWVIYGDEAGTVVKFKFDYTRDGKGNVIQIRSKDNQTFRRYTYEKSLSPFALFNPDLCFFIATNRDQWTSEAPVSDFEGNEYRGFLPLYNIKSEQMTGLEIFGYTLNSKGMAITKNGSLTAAYTFQGCGF
ncbi:fibronectin type III domain-containing protein [uncultured Microscilla sp.]|uniref:fibronectin type III domain-containing protein n=1 Tax=uncultured Microscilla sp. TaxID=432653 RepID=UPI00260D2FAD|nr:fibronectin type III domain-containing protein [uncultured Microscilla sp.]